MLSMTLALHNFKVISTSWRGGLRHLSCYGGAGSRRDVDRCVGRPHDVIAHDCCCTKEDCGVLVGAEEMLPAVTVKGGTDVGGMVVSLLNEARSGGMVD